MDNYVPILFGSQTGNGESIAELLLDASEDHGIDCSIHPMNEFDISPDDTCIIFICSSTGDGEIPDNALKFVKNLKRKSLSADHLSHLHYALLALGDSNYPTFGGGPKALERLLKSKGAKTFYPTKLADDATSLELVVEPWIEGLWPALKNHLKSQKNKPENDDTSTLHNGSASITNGMDKLEITDEQPIIIPSIEENPLHEVLSHLNADSVKLPPALVRYLKAERLDENSSPSALDYEYIPHPLQEGKLFDCEIEDVSQLTQDGAVKQCLQVSLKIPNDCCYEPGDAFGVLTPNTTEEVNWLLQRLKLFAEADMKVFTQPSAKKKNPKIPVWIPEIFTPRYLLTNCLELRNVPKRMFLRLLLDCTSDKNDKDILKCLCSKDGMKHYMEMIVEPHLNILDILSFLPSCNPPLDLLIEHLPRLQARLYSAASAQSIHKTSVKFAFNVVEFPKNEHRSYSRDGLATGFFKQLLNKNLYLQHKIQIFKSKNISFRLPEDPLVPIILVGPGTGVAPFIGFLQQRRHLYNTETRMGQAWLFYGCRQKDKDYLYKNEIDGFLNDGILTKFSVCFSREASDGPKYVQDNLVKHSDEVMKLLLDDDAVFYVCGDAKNMAKDVKETMVAMVSKAKDISQDQAVDFVKELISQKRYLEDVWA